MTVRLALISDIHANLPALHAVMRDLEERAWNEPLEGVYCLGDLGGYGGSPNEVQATVMAAGYPTLSGNYDENVGFERDDCGCQNVKPFDIEMSAISFTWTREHTNAANRSWLRSLPRGIRLSVEGRRVLLCHGSPRSNTEYLFENRSDGYLRQFTTGGRADAQVDVIVFGHTHVPYHRKVDGVHFINTGSVGRPKDGDARAGYCMLTIERDSVRSEQIRIQYDVERACHDLVAEGLPAYFADNLRTGGNVPGKRS
jgi:putative phosphoesterase